MKSLHTRLARLAAITCIGLSGSAFAVFAQAPATPGGPPATNGPAPISPLRCEPGLVAMSILHGKIDNFAGGGDSPPTPSDPLKIQFPQLVSQAANNIFDNTG